MRNNEKTKLAATKSAYQSVINRLQRHAEVMRDANAIGEVTDTNLLIAAAYLDLEPKLQPSSARFYLAALTYAIENNPGPNDSEIIELFKPEPSAEQTLRHYELEMLRKNNLTALRCAQQRADFLPHQEWIELTHHLLATKSKWRMLAVAWIVCTRECGLRPIEWQKAKLVGSNLVVQNAKVTNGRSHGRTRTISLRLVRSDIMDVLNWFISDLNKQCETTSFNSIYNAVRELIYDVSRRCLSTRKRYPTLYTARNDFASRAKNTFPRDAVAALMGHGSIDTAARYYAAARHTKGGRPLAVEPAAKDIDAVRKNESSKFSMNNILDTPQNPGNINR